MGWGSLRVWNDDEIAPNTGFPPHPHANMEIITYVREGAVTHKDSLGNEGRTEAGDVQVMSAGTGIRHAEYNLEQQPTRIFQIWITPSSKGGSPAWGAQPFPKADRSGRFVTLASGFDNDNDALPIRAQARVLGATLKVGETVEYALGERRHGYLVPASGAVEVNGVRIDARDGAAIKDVAVVRITAIEEFRARNGRRAVRQVGCATHKTIEEKIMSKVLVLYYSSYGHIEAMANAVAEGARQAGAHVDIKRVPELVPEEIARKSHYKLDQAAPIAKIEDLAAYDAIVVGAGTRFGRLPSQMANFLDQAGGLWLRGALHGKVGGAFTSSATQHGGQETTLFSIITNLLHFGMVIVGLDYGHAGQMTLDEITGGSPYGATTIAGGDGSRQPTANELEGARYQGRKIAETANKLHG